MPIFKNKLDELLADGVLASGTMKQVVLEQVRAYLRETPIQQLKLEVSQLKSLPQLAFLQAAGVPGGLQPVFLNLYAELSGKL